MTGREIVCTLVSGGGSDEQNLLGSFWASTPTTRMTATGGEAELSDVEEKLKNQMQSCDLQLLYELNVSRVQIKEVLRCV